MADKLTRMSRTLPSFYKAETNTMIGGILKAWAIEDAEIEIQIQNTKEQLFEKLAEGRFLGFLGDNVGVDRPTEIGLLDDDYRNLIPVMSFFPKQVRGTIIALLDVFWGPGFTRPNVNSQNIETYNFGPTSLLTGTMNFIEDAKVVKGTGTLFTLELIPGDYIKPSSASGDQYSKVLNIISDTELEFSEPWQHPIALNATTSKGIIRTLEYEVDGRVNKTIRFIPNAFEDLTAVTVAELIEFINTNIEHNVNITASEFLDPQAGSRLNIRTNTPGLQGSIQILGGDANDVTRLDFLTEINTEIKANVLEINSNEVIVRIPSTVPILRRTLAGSAHLKETKTEIFSDVEVYDFSGLGASSTLDIDVDGSPFTVTFTHATDFVNDTSVTAEEIAEVIDGQLLFMSAFVALSKDRKKVGLRTTDGSSEYQVTGGTANAVLNFDTSLQEDPDLIRSEFPSSYLFNPTGQLFTVTSINSELSSAISEGSISPVINVNDASGFPNNPGQLVFNFGRGKEEGPIDYTSRPNNSSLLIDASHIFENEHIVGSKVNFVIDEPTIPRVTGEDFPVFVVGTEQARKVAQELIRRLLAAGVVIRFIIDFPEFLFVCTCRGCGPSEATDFRGSLTNSGPLVF